MNAKGLFRATPQGFVPFEHRSEELLRKLLARQDGKPVFLSVRTARNPEFSALAHVVFTLLADGLGLSMEAVKNYLKEQTGRFDIVKMPDGTLVKNRHSVAFSAMSEEQFREFWTACLPIIYDKLLGGVPSDTYKEIVDTLDGKRKGRYYG